MVKNNQKIRVAQIMGKMLGGGVEAVVMNYYRHIDKSKIQFDFICDEDSTNIPYEEIKALGGKVILVPKYQKIVKYHKELKRIFKENNYQIVHSHINTLSVFPLFAAWCAKVPVRIAHSHSTTNKKEKKKNLLKQILRPLNKLFTTDYMACTEHAGRWMFGEKQFKKGNIYILNNAIELEKFKYQQQIRKEKRNELNIKDDTIVIGHIGRFVEQKNHSFLIEIFNEFHKENENSILLLVGQGPLLSKMQEKVNSLKLDNTIFFLGQREDVNELYQAFDLFLFPSLYEGLGMVMIEAQVSGLSCIASNEVPLDAKVSENVEFLSISLSTGIWGDTLKKLAKIKRKDNMGLISEKGYNIKFEAKNLEEKYISLLEGC